MVRPTKKQQPVATKSKFGWTEFVDIKVPEEAFDDVMQHFGTSEQLYAAMTDLVANGYRVGFSFNVQSEAVICSITCKVEGHVNEGKTVNSFAGSWFDALAVALYKHYVIAAEDWGGDNVVSARPRFG